MARELPHSGAPRSFKTPIGREEMTRRATVRTSEQSTFLRKLRRYPVDRALSQVGNGRKGRDFWDLVQYVLAQR